MTRVTASYRRRKVVERRISKTLRERATKNFGEELSHIWGLNRGSFVLWWDQPWTLLFIRTAPNVPGIDETKHVCYRAIFQLAREYLHGVYSNITSIFTDGFRMASIPTCAFYVLSECNVHSSLKSQDLFNCSEAPRNRGGGSIQLKHPAFGSFTSTP